MADADAKDPFADLDAELRARLDDCRDSLRRLGRVAVAFSGGVDSTLLAALAGDALGRDNVLAVTAVSPLHPAGERDEARRLAKRIGVRQVELETDELSDAAVAANRPDRCYHCKKALLGRVRAAAAAHGFEAVATGANADDAADYRPGLRAGAEMGAARPLMEAGLTKADVRAASRALGLPGWDRPATACLATRVPYGRRLTREALQRIDRAEQALRAMGFDVCRVRDHDALARVEVPPERIAEAMERREAVVAELRDVGYAYVTVDLAGYRAGSMNDALQAPPDPSAARR